MFWLPIILTVIVFFGGGTPIWVQGFVFFGLGICLLLRPPERALGRSLDWALAGMLLVSLLALMPASMLPYGAWRNEAIDVYGLDLGWMLASEPQKVLEQFVFMLGVFAWFYFLMSFPLTHSSRIKVLNAYLACMLVLALGMLIGNALHCKYFFAPSSTVFSYFPNRNQTSTTFCMAAITAFGLSMYGFRYKRLRRALLSFFALIFLFVALLLSISRGGILLFFVGCIAIFVYKPLKRKWRFFFCLVLPILILIVSFAFLNQGPLMQRFESLIKDKGDYRLDVYADTMDLILDQPLSGVGQGNFSAVFPQYENKAAIDQRLIHPESDWFWFVAEVGLGGFLLLILVFVFLVRAVFPFARGREEALRIIPAAAFTAFLFHSMFDVPAHRLGTVFIAVFLLRLACREDAWMPCFYPKSVFRCVGILLMGFGATWVIASCGAYRLHSETQFKHDDAIVIKSTHDQDLDALNESLERLITCRPLDWWPYFERGRARLIYNHDIPAAEEDFLRARFLQPTAQELTYYEGLLWLPYSPSRAYDAWSDALSRKARNPGGLYENMRREGSQFPNFKTYLRKLTLQDSAFRFYYLMHSESYVFNTEMNWQVKNEPTFPGFSEQQVFASLSRWSQVGEPKYVLDYFSEHPHILEQVPCLEAYVLAREDNFEEASKHLLSYLDVPSFPRVPEKRDLATIQRSFVKNPDNIWDGTALLQYYLKVGDKEKALEIVQKLSLAEHIPSYVLYWKARLSTEFGDYTSAWSMWEAYLNLGGSGFVCPKKSVAHSEAR